MLVGVSVIEILLFNRKKKKKNMATLRKFQLHVLHLYYKLFLIFFPDIISFQHVFHLCVGRSQIEWKLKVKISVFPWAKIGQNDHSNPYIESTTVLSDTFYYDVAIMLHVLNICLILVTNLLKLIPANFMNLFPPRQVPNLFCARGKNRRRGWLIQSDVNGEFRAQIAITNE